jgi:hypothetical protein
MYQPTINLISEQWQRDTEDESDRLGYGTDWFIAVDIFTRVRYLRYCSF